MVFPEISRREKTANLPEMSSGISKKNKKFTEGRQFLYTLTCVVSLPSTMKNITINHITKIEGHATLNLKIDNGIVKKAEIKSVEGARFFEDIVKGRRWDEVNTLTSRICGTCSPAHSINALMAVENAFGINPSTQTKMLRELLSLGSIIQNHTAHLYFLALPDYLGYESAIQMASRFKPEIKRALNLKHIGNKMGFVIGGREVHPVANRVGYFSNVPKKEQLKDILSQLKSARTDAIKTMDLFSKLHYPRFERKTRYFANRGKVYNMLFGPIHCHNCCGSGICIPDIDYENHFNEYFEEGNDSKLVRALGKSYMVGALARLNVNADILPQKLKKIIPFKLPNYSPFMNNVSQAFEIVWAIERCIELIERLEPRQLRAPDIKPKAGRGIATTEAPRGVLIHDYTFDKSGYVKKANIITPTTQNLASMEDDIKEFVPPLLKADISKERIVLEIEKLIRAYDPCISCATHFLKVNWL